MKFPYIFPKAWVIVSVYTFNIQSEGGGSVTVDVRTQRKNATKCCIIIVVLDLSSIIVELDLRGAPHIGATCHSIAHPRQSREG